MSTMVLWGILILVEVADNKFCKQKAERLGINVRKLRKTKSEPMDFLYDVIVGLLALNIILIQTKITISLIIATLILIVCVYALFDDIRRLSNKEAD